MKLSLLLKTRTLNVLIGCLMVAALLGACGGEGGNTANTANTANTTNTANTANTNAAAPANTAPANTASTANANTAGMTADKIGVPECDEYISKWEACVNSKVPEAMRASFKSGFDTQRKAWRDAAATPQGKAGLAQGCKAALDAAKTSFASYGCSW